MKTYTPDSLPFDKDSLLQAIKENVRQELTLLAEKSDMSLEIFVQQEKVADYEDIIEAVLVDIPSELQQKKIKEYTDKDMTLESALRDALDLIRKRKMMWKYEGKEEYEPEILKTIKIFEGAKYQQELFEGRGNAAYVFQVPDVPNVCIKFLHSPQMQRYSPEREFGILSSVNEIASELKVLKVPQAHAVAVHNEADKSFFTMETIDGITLQEMIDTASKRKEMFNQSGISESQVIDILSDKSLQGKMKRDLETIHKHGILHGDIHPRNIMMSRDGTFYLIDFGNAMITSALPPGVDYDTIENTKEIDLKAFVNCFEMTAKTLKKQLENAEEKSI